MTPDRGFQALPGLTAGRRRICAGCGRPFQPARTTQRHCRPSCRVTAFRKRREHVPDLLRAIDCDRERTSS